MPVSTSLRGRVPGQGVIGDIVTAQKDVPARSLIARIFGVSPLTSATRALYRAAIGELAVAEMLDQLGTRWDVLHVVPMNDVAVCNRNGDSESADGSAQIDHLVIGPPGVFSLTTENYPGEEIRVSGDAMTIGGKSVDDILVARGLATAAASRLSSATDRTVRVEPVIVVIDSSRLVLREQPTGVTVVRARHLVRLLTRLDRTLPGARVAQISDLAERDTTWDSSPTPPENGVALSDEFARIRDQVRNAMQARVLWIIFGFAVVSATAWVGTVLIVESALGQYARRSCRSRVSTGHSGR
jgi:hypothetical protein